LTVDGGQLTVIQTANEGVKIIVYHQLSTVKRENAPQSTAKTEIHWLLQAIVGTFFDAVRQ